jgi:hypothetical protein
VSIINVLLSYKNLIWNFHQLSPRKFNFCGVDFEISKDKDDFVIDSLSNEHIFLIDSIDIWYDDIVMYL